MSKIRDDIFNDILVERHRQDDKWGVDRNHHSFYWLAILGEEFGEVCERALKMDLRGMRYELVQLAAVVVVILEAIDKGQGLKDD